MGKRKNCKNCKIWDETHIINTNIILHKLSFSFIRFCSLFCTTIQNKNQWHLKSGNVFYFNEVYFMFYFFILHAFR